VVDIVDCHGHGACCEQHLVIDALQAPSHGKMVLGSAGSKSSCPWNDDVWMGAVFL